MSKRIRKSDRGEAAPAGGGARRSYEAWAMLALAAASFAVFANTLGGAFVYDDLRQIVGNPFIQEGRYLFRALASDVWAFKGDTGVSWSNYWRPTFILWLTANYRLFGLERTIGWHLGNVMLHACIVLLAFRLLRRLALPLATAFAIALLFAVHPAHVESVAWISGSPDLLLAAALLGALLFLLGGRRDPLRSAAALGLHAVALLSKETAVLFPGLVLVAAHATAPQELSRRERLAFAARNAVPFAVLALLFLVARYYVLGRLEIETPWRLGPVGFLLTLPSLLFFYLRQAIFPLWLGPSYPLRAVTPASAGLGNFVLPLLVASSALILLALAARREPVRRIGLALFLLLLLPAMNVNAFIPEQLVHDRYLYLPLLGLLLVVWPWLTDGLARWRGLGAQAAAWLAAAAAVPLALQTISYNSAWLSEKALWSRAIAADPTSASNLAEYGRVLTEEGRLPEARAALDRALAIYPVSSAYLQRATVAIAQQRWAEAENDLRLVLAEQPDNPAVYDRLALVYQHQGRLADAEATLRAGRDRFPYRSCTFTDNLAVVLYLTGRKSEALRELESVRDRVAHEYGARGTAVLFRLGLLYAELGRAADARSAFEDYLAQTANVTDAATLQNRAQSEQTLAQLRE